jgi:hypothetical protein
MRFYNILILFMLTINYMGSMLLRTINDDEIVKGNKGLHLKNLLFLDIYRIQIVQNTTQLSSKGIFIQPPLFLIH